MFRNCLTKLNSSARNYSASPVLKLAREPQVKLITAKRTQYNLILNSEIPKGKNNEILLASQNWQHYKSKGDHFIIHPVQESASIMGDQRFEDILDSRIVENMRTKHQISVPTKIQEEAIKLILNREHVLLAAETGSGKSHAFLLPIIQSILEKKHKTSKRDFNTPLALILTPGRELAEQLGEMAEQLCSDLNINVKVVLGGKTKSLMLYPSFEDVDILIGSLGAISKLTTTGIYHMEEVRHVVLDESDTLLDDSFTEKLSYFLRRFPFHKNYIQSDLIVGTQLILSSATMPTNSEEIFRTIVDPDTIQNVISENLHRVLPNIHQRFLRTNKLDRSVLLLKLVQKELEKHRPVIIFGNKSSTSDYISIFLNDNGINCINLNGDMLQKIRIGRFEQFQNGNVDVLSTTDIGSRGLNTTRARHVVNFDFPLHVSDYIHRCGRVGRLGSAANCYVTNYVSSLREIELVRKIEYSVRTQSVLQNVNANITNIINKKIEKEIEKYEKLL